MTYASHTRHYRRYAYLCAETWNLEDFRLIVADGH